MALARLDMVILHKENIPLGSRASNVKLFQGFLVHLLSIQVFRLLELLFIQDYADITKII